jgi:hypothetical protein
VALGVRKVCPYCLSILLLACWSQCLC